jgi:hypothetical protein
MKYLLSFIAFWKDLLIGDDWTIAAGVVVTLAAAWVLVHAAIVPWLWLPLGVGVILTESLRRA